MRFIGRHRVLAFGRLLAVVVAAVGVSLSIAACGSDSEEGNAATTTSAGTSPAAVEAQKVVDMADGKLVYSSAEIPTSAADLEPYGEWRGPTSAPAHEPGKLVQVIVCTKQAAACMDGARGVQEAAGELGWRSDVIDGGGTPQAFASAFDTALSRNPDAIVMIAVPTVAVGDSLLKAREAGVVTVAEGDVQPTRGIRADAYVSFPMPAMSAVLAQADIAAHDGAAKTINLADRGFPSLIQTAEAFEQNIESCEGCAVYEEAWQLTDALDPTKIQSIIRGALSAHPDATGLNLPYSEGLPAVVQAVNSAGRDLAIYVKDGDSVGLEGVADGSVAASAGSSVVWAGWAAIDQVIRGLAGEPYLGPTDTGLGVALFTKETVPPGGQVDGWDGLVDYRAEYRKAWK